MVPKMTKRCSKNVSEMLQRCSNLCYTSLEDSSPVLRSNTSSDTVHEMARDEARHGVALKGMLERYFK